MLENLKALLQIKDNIDDIRRAAVQNRDSIISLSQELEEFKAEFGRIREGQKGITAELKLGIDALKSSKEDLRKEVYDFNLLKGELQKQIISKFEQELHSVLGAEIERIKASMSSYNDLKQKVESIAQRTAALAAEIDKLLQVSQAIKQKDFEMEKTAKQLLEMDKEKLELMRKIDTLERLVARMRHN